MKKFCNFSTVSMFRFSSAINYRSPAALIHARIMIGHTCGRLSSKHGDAAAGIPFWYLTEVILLHLRPSGDTFMLFYNWPAASFHLDLDQKGDKSKFQLHS